MFLIGIVLIAVVILLAGMLYKLEKLWTWHKYNYNKEVGEKFREFIGE